MNFSLQFCQYSFSQH